MYSTTPEHSSTAAFHSRRCFVPLVTLTPKGVLTGMGKMRKNIRSALMPGLLATLTVSAMSPEARRSFAEFEKRVEAEDPEALYRMSVILEQGYDSIPRDSIRSISLLIKSAEKDLARHRIISAIFIAGGNVRASGSGLGHLLVPEGS